MAQDGVVYVWGDNTYGQRGIEAKNSKYSQYASFTVKGASAGDNADGALNDFIDITIGDTFISALRRDGNVFSWGSGSYGQIGKGFFTEALAPTQAVNGESASSTAYLRNIVKILQEHITILHCQMTAVYMLGVEMQTVNLVIIQ